MDASHIDRRSVHTEEIDRLADQFEREFQAGKTPRIEEYLDQEPALRDLLLAELLAVEIELRQLAGECVSLNEYEKRFPDDRERLASLISRDLASATDGGGTETDTTFVSSEKKQAEQTADRKPGQLVGRRLGPYVLEEHIGSGGMGDVYRGHHTLLGRQRAVKVIRSDFARSPEAVKRFIREAQATSDLRHPNIVTLQEVSQDGDTLYLVMELLDGEDLATTVARTGPLELSNAMHFVGQIAEGLRFAHKLGYVHRDVKPHNIFVTNSGDAKLLDLGLARLVQNADQGISDSKESSDGMQELPSEQLTEGRVRLGTPAYMSPEQRNNPRLADARSDIYSLGRALIYLIGGSTALGPILENGNNVQATPGTDSLPKLPSCVPESIRFVVRRMISPNPDERFPNADQLITGLSHWQRTYASPVFPRTSWKSVRRRLIWVTFALLFFSSMVPSALHISYNANAIRFLTGRELQQFFQSVNIANMIVLPIGILLRVGIMFSVVRPFSMVEKGTFNFAFLPTVKARCLILGRMFFAIGLFEWLIMSIVFASTSLPYEFRVGMIFTTVLCGLLTALIHFFCLVAIALKVAYPALLRMDMPDDDESRRLSRLSRQIVAIQLLATVLPFAAMIAYQFPPMDAGVGRPFVIGLMVVSIVIAVILTYLGRSLQSDIRVLQGILQTSLPSYAQSDGNNRSR